MSVCLSLSIYLSIYLCIYVSMYLCMYGWMDVCMDVWIYGCMDVCMYLSVYLSIYVALYLCIYASISAKGWRGTKKPCGVRFQHLLFHPEIHATGSASAISPRDTHCGFARLPLHTEVPYGGGLCGSAHVDRQRPWPIKGWHGGG